VPCENPAHWCNRIEPQYQPLLSPEVYMGKRILVIWAPGGDTRPYQTPRSRNDPTRVYYVRLGSETVEARDEILNELMQMTARIPFDDRRNMVVTTDVLSPSLVRNFLADVHSDLRPER
jgi:ATP-dependent DNA helicase RecG